MFIVSSVAGLPGQGHVTCLNHRQSPTKCIVHKIYSLFFVRIPSATICPVGSGESSESSKSSESSVTVGGFPTLDSPNSQNGSYAVLYLT